MTHVEIRVARDKSNTMMISYFHQELASVAERLAEALPYLIENESDKLRLRKVKTDEVRVDVQEHGRVSGEADLTVSLYLDGTAPESRDQQVICDRATNMVGRWMHSEPHVGDRFDCSIELTVQWIQSARMQFGPDWQPLDIL